MSALGKANSYAYTIAAWGKRFPVLLKTPNPRGHVELIEIVGKGNYGNVYKASIWGGGDRRKGEELRRPSETRAPIKNLYRARLVPRRSAP